MGFIKRMRDYLARAFFNRIKARPAVVTKRDGTLATVSVLTRESSGNWYVFDYPYRAWDIGFSVNPKYIRYLSFYGSVYIWLATKAVAKFPEWVEV